MKRKIFSILFALLLACSLGLVTAVPAVAQGTVPDRATAIINAADRLVTLQNEDGGFPWKITDPAGPSATNCLGVTAMGIMEAWKLNPKPEYNTALAKAYKYVVDMPPEYMWDVSKYTESTKGVDSCPDITFLVRLAEATAGDADLLTAINELQEPDITATNIADLARVRWDDRVLYLGSATEEPAGTATGLAEYIRDARHGQNLDALIPWDLELGVEAALALDNVYPEGGYGQQAIDITNAIYAAIDDGTHFDSTDTGQEDYIAGLTGAVKAAAETGLHTEKASDLLTLLLDTQQPDGSWKYYGATPVDMSVQSTAYAIMALFEEGSTEAVSAANAAADWLVSVQKVDGGWYAEGGAGDEYAEIDSEAAWALARLPAPVTIDTKGYYSIQSAIDSSLPGDTISVAAGAYDEQVVINKSLTLQGAGDATIVKPSSEAKLTSLYTLGTQDGALWSGNKLASIISVVGAGSVTVKDLKVDGVTVDSLPSGANYIVGISFGETAGTIENVTVVKMDTTSQAPRTYGVWLDAVATTVSVEVKGCDINLYNKNGINARGAKLTVSIHDNTVTGPGNSPQVPNGIGLISGAKGTVGPNNTITHHEYIPGTWTACGIFTYDVADTIIEGNTISASYTGVGLSGAPGVSGTTGTIVRENTITGAKTGVQLECQHTINNTITGNDIHDCEYGIYLEGPLSPDWESSYAGYEVGAGNVADLNNIANNTEYGAANFNPDVSFDATNNWWGNASGPIPTGTYESYGDKVSGNVDYEPWLLEEVVPEVTPTIYDKTLALKDGWTLVSTDKPATTGTTWVETTLALKYTPSGGFVEAALTDLEPLNAIYVKTEDGGGVGINYGEVGPGVIYSKDLEAGWNLISSNSDIATKALLSPLRFVTIGTQQGVGLATLASQGDYNQFSASFYVATLTDADWDNLPTPLNTFDGYWAYMNAAKTFEVIP